MTGNAGDAEYANFLKGTTEPILEKPFSLKAVKQVVCVLLDGQDDFGEMSPKGQRLDWWYLQSLGRGCWSGVYQRRRADAERHSCWNCTPVFCGVLPC
jgi:hypothetical protein